LNKIRIGNSEYSIICWIVSLVPILVILVFNPPPLVIFMVIVNIIIGLIAICWMPTLVAKYRLRPAIDKCKPDETTWCRVTKDRIVVPQFVSKGPYGRNKGVTYHEKADIIDDGSFPVKWLNGNPCVLMYDLINTSIDLNKSVARKIMKQKYGIRSGVEGYEKAKEQRRVMFKHG